MFDLKKAASLNLGRKLDAISGVVIHAGKNSAGQEVTYSAGDSTGYVIDINCDIGSQLAADHILSSLRLRGFRYQPFEASKVIADPACEIGDSASADSDKSIIFSRATPFTDLMYSDLAAKYDEEIDHEYGFIPRTSREFSRESAYTRSRLSITDTEISAKVSKTGGSASSFGWTLTDSQWILASNSQTVFKVNRDGAEVMGKITATSGYIGTQDAGFEITSSSIRNGMTSLYDSAHEGVYVGTDGIALGAGAFRATSSGAVSCSAITITGGEIKGTTEMTSGKVGGASVGSHSFGGIPIPSSGGTAGQLIIPSGHIGSGAVGSTNLASKAVQSAAIDDHAVKSVNLSQKCVLYDNIGDEAVATDKVTSGINTNLGYAANYGSATVSGTSVYPSSFTAGTVNGSVGRFSSALICKGRACSWVYLEIGGSYYWVMTGTGD